jgi:hypothetical protein
MLSMAAVRDVRGDTVVHRIALRQSEDEQVRRRDTTDGQRRRPMRL